MNGQTLKLLSNESDLIWGNVGDNVDLNMPMEKYFDQNDTSTMAGFAYNYLNDNYFICESFNNTKYLNRIEINQTATTRFYDYEIYISNLTQEEYLYGKNLTYTLSSSNNAFKYMLDKSRGRQYVEIACTNCTNWLYIDMLTNKSFNWFVYFGSTNANYAIDNIYFNVSSDGTNWINLMNVSGIGTPIAIYNNMNISGTYRYLNISFYSDAVSWLDFERLYLFRYNFSNMNFSSINYTYHADASYKNKTYSNQSFKTICLRAYNYSGAGYMYHNEMRIFGYDSMTPANIAPNLSILNYVNQSFTYQNNSNILLQVNCSDADNNSRNVSMFINGVFNSTLTNGSTNTFSFYYNLSPHSSVNVSYNCSDGIDSDYKNGLVLSYQNTACQNTASPTSFNFNYTTTSKNFTNVPIDYDGDVMTGYFFLNSTLMQTWNSVSNGTTLWNVSPLTHSSVGFEWRCRDNYSASNTSNSYSANFNNQAPYFVENLSASYNMLNNETFSLDVNCSDYENDTITYSIITTDADMTINPATGLITDATPTSVNVAVYCNDSITATSQSFNLVVHNATSSGTSSSDLGIGLILIGILFAYIILGLNLSDDHSSIKLGFILMSFIFILASLYVGWKMFDFTYAGDYYAFEDVSNALRILFMVNIPFFIFTMGYFVYYFIFKMIASIGKRWRK